MLDCYIFTPRIQFGANCYVLSSGGEYAVIDPSVSYDDVIQTLPDISGKVKYIILTHSHFDHTLELENWMQNTTLEPSMSENAYVNIGDSLKNCYWQFFRIDKAYTGKYTRLQDCDVLTLGEDKIHVIETPGHTNGSICLITADRIFAGDTIFEGGSYGRYDLPGGNASELSSSIKKLLSYGDDMIILSGHGAATTVKEAKNYRYL